MIRDIRRGPEKDQVPFFGVDGLLPFVRMCFYDFDHLLEFDLHRFNDCILKVACYV